jgi:hypothetical protein
VRGAHRAVRHMRLYLLLLSVQLVLCGAFTAQSANSPPDSSLERKKRFEFFHNRGTFRVVSGTCTDGDTNKSECRDMNVAGDIEELSTFAVSTQSIPETNCKRPKIILTSNCFSTTCNHQKEPEEARSCSSSMGYCKFKNMMYVVMCVVVILATHGGCMPVGFEILKLQAECDCSFKEDGTIAIIVAFVLYCWFSAGLIAALRAKFTDRAKDEGKDEDHR